MPLSPNILLASEPPTLVLISNEQFPPPLFSGSVGMGSMGSWEPINYLAVGSGTHQFHQEEIRIFLLSMKTEVRALEIAYRNPSIRIPNEATVL